MSMSMHIMISIFSYIVALLCKWNAGYAAIHIRTCAHIVFVITMKNDSVHKASQKMIKEAEGTALFIQFFIFWYLETPNPT